MTVKLAAAGMPGLVAATATGAGPGFDVQGCEDFSLQVEFTGGNPTVVVYLQATNDPPNITDANATWYTILTFNTSTDASGQIVTVTGTPVRRIRAYLETLSGGTSPTVTATLGAT